MLMTAATENAQNPANLTSPEITESAQPSRPAATYRPIFASVGLDALSRIRWQRDPHQHYAFDGFKVLDQKALSDEATFQRIFNQMVNTVLDKNAQRAVLACQLGSKMPQFYNSDGLAGIAITGDSYLICRTYEMHQMVVVDCLNAKCPIETTVLTSYLLKQFKPANHSLCRDLSPGAKFLKQTVALREDSLPFPSDGQRLVAGIVKELQLFPLSPNFIEQSGDEAYTIVQPCAEGHIALQTNPYETTVNLLCAQARHDIHKFIRLCGSRRCYSIQRCTRLELI